MTTQAIELPQQLRRFSGPAIATAGAVLAFGVSMPLVVLAGIVSYFQIAVTLTEIFHVSGIDISPPGWAALLLVDRSAVSPLLCTFSALCMATGAVALAFQPTRTSGVQHFPFPAPYRGFFTMFGLVGTLVGFAIAFSPLDAASLEGEAFAQTQVLLAGLATALYSSLVAIVLAYCVCPPIEAIYRTLRRIRTGERPADPRVALQSLSKQFGDTAEALDRLETSACQTAGHLDLPALMGRLDALRAHVDSAVAQGAELAERINAAQTTWVKELCTTERQLSTLGDSIEHLGAAERHNAARLDDLDTRLETLTNGLRRLAE